MAATILGVVIITAALLSFAAVTVLVQFAIIDAMVLGEPDEWP